MRGGSLIQQPAFASRTGDQPAVLVALRRDPERSLVVTPLPARQPAAS
jgi:hypothetical protein